MTVRELIDYLEKVEDKDQLVVICGFKESFVKIDEPHNAVLTPGYNWKGKEERPAILIEPLFNEWDEEVCW